MRLKRRTAEQANRPPAPDLSVVPVVDMARELKSRGWMVVPADAWGRAVVELELLERHLPVLEQLRELAGTALPEAVETAIENMREASEQRWRADRAEAEVSELSAVILAEVLE